MSHLCAICLLMSLVYIIINHTMNRSDLTIADWDDADDARIDQSNNPCSELLLEQ